MIATIIIFSIAFYWLLVETDWLQVRLLAGISCIVGTCSDWRLADNQVTDDMKRELYNSNGRYGKRHSTGEFVEWMNPLCGWGFAYQYRNFKPEYKIELIDEHSHYTMRTNNTEILRDAFKVYRNPYTKVKTLATAREWLEPKV